VSAISGSIIPEIGKILNQPTQIIDLLATALPAQATYFIQIVFISTAIGLGLELLRVVPIALSSIRKCVGPRLTEKQRSKRFIFLSDISDPGDFGYAGVLGQMVLAFTVLLVYTVIAPIVPFILGFCFFCNLVAYKNQFIYIYRPLPDSGGHLFMGFIRIMLTCIMIGEITSKFAGLADSFQSPVSSR
jgi:hypothetical protein